MSANYTIYTSPSHQPIPDHLPTLIITPHGKPSQILYTYLHTNYNQENYLLTPSDQGDLCVAKLFPFKRLPSGPSAGNNDRMPIRCEASRNLKWMIRNEGIQNPVYKLTLPNPDNPQLDQPLFQVSKPNPNSPWWTLFYFTYAGHLIPPKRVEFGKIIKSQPNPRGGGGETKITITGKTDEEKAVWKTLGDGNEDMVEWIIVCAALNVLDEEISKAAQAAKVQLAPSASSHQHLPSNSSPKKSIHPTGNLRQTQPAPIKPAVYNNKSSHHHHHQQQQQLYNSSPHHPNSTRPPHPQSINPANRVPLPSSHHHSPPSHTRNNGVYPNPQEPIPAGVVARNPSHHSNHNHPSHPRRKSIQVNQPSRLELFDQPIQLPYTQSSPTNVIPAHHLYQQPSTQLAPMGPRPIHHPHPLPSRNLRPMENPQPSAFHHPHHSPHRPSPHPPDRQPTRANYNNLSHSSQRQVK
ncbi:hypothetical protein O181_097766 [Austropuccinia psidii MF-1]|uniref:Uncharacterized protein n=1 Tax=Austropuccinia psidii MF-1 TaxID=1389203 RepID=A0A9Q3PFD2_9BASI|nr:hypothetical protein [Austropuccinia psidii MF-1]